MVRSKFIVYYIFRARSGQVLWMNFPVHPTQRQGSRTPHTDPLARGAFIGLTLSHTRAHIFRAILESVCYGTRSCFDALEAAAQVHPSPKGEAVDRSDEVVIAGGEIMKKRIMPESLLSF